MALRAVFNHLVLPPRVPGGPDEDEENVSHEVLARLSSTCYNTFSNTESSWSAAFRGLQASLSACEVLHQSGGLDRTALLAHFKQLKPGHILVLHIIPQNAALLVWAEIDDNGDEAIVIEAFEASPTTTAVLATPRVLEWSFPGRSCRISPGDFHDPNFQQCLANFLEQASSESLHTLKAHVTKAGKSVAEERDTPSPALVTEMLMSIFEAVGKPRQPPRLMWKHVRDDVNMQDSNQPWRRLPFWLVLRVAARRQLALILGETKGRFAYKCLMAVMFAQLLKDSAGSLPPDLAITLRAKLCRRMAKLEMDLKQMESSGIDACKAHFDATRHLVRASVEHATDQVVRAWAFFKHKTKLVTPRLPEYADSSSLQLSLPNSGAYLDRLLVFQAPPRAAAPSLDLPRPLDATIQRSQDFTNKVFNIAALESGQEVPGISSLSNEARCLRLGERITKLFADTHDLSSGDPAQQSSRTLAIFCLWTQLDKAAVEACPLLKDYAPVFKPEMLDVLQLPNMREMRRLQDVQAYLNSRRSEARHGNIFQVVDMESFAVRYTSQSTGARAHGVHVQSLSDQKKRAKKLEWINVCREYDEHTSQFSNGTCRCSYVNGERDIRGCKRCYHNRVRNRLSLQVFEQFLPELEPARSTVLFELVIPAHLAIYRDMTWKIASMLAHPSRPKQDPFKTTTKLLEHTPLWEHTAQRKQIITLASPIKCFVDTHYKFVSGKMALEAVVVPLGARFQLYDQVSKIWVSDLTEELTLQHLCGIQVPLALRSTVLPAVLHPPPHVDGPSSYEVQANKSVCPPDVSSHEFSAHQELLSGTIRRWAQVLVQLGSSSLNFSSEETTRLISQLATQAGPRLDDDILRKVHACFREPGFVERLARGIEKRIKSILTNWREHQCMDMLITLALRIYQLAPDDTGRRRAQDLLEMTREALLGWTVQISGIKIPSAQSSATTDGDTAQRASGYCLWASLLCRRTFDVYADLAADGDFVLEPEHLASWIQASVALQESIMVDIDELPVMEKHALIRDSKAAYYLAPLLRRSVVAHPAAVGRGIDASWSGRLGADEAPSDDNIISSWKILASHDRWAVGCTVAQEAGRSRSQAVHCNFIEGHLLVDGKARGKLPLEIRNSPDVKALFDSQSLLTHSSAMHRMTHRLANLVHNQEVHFGLDQSKNAVIQTWSKTHGHFQFIPYRIFTHQSNPKSAAFDLPLELVEGCAHWLNLKSGRLEIRRKADIWFNRPRNWALDVTTRRAFRGNVTLVDPWSKVFGSINGILAHFERPEGLTVYQPEIGRLKVDMRRLDLAFGVNQAGRLQCQQLGAEIDPDQDAGTWYGLASKIVVRDLTTQERSILLPLGTLSGNRHGMHVQVRMSDSKTYGRFGIDTVLGRLTCPPEPRLLLTKALCHGLTSFCLPDPLTKRTGTEEAFEILSSGTSQPWQPISPDLKPLLESFSSLIPEREYYPPQLKRIQRVTWHDTLTTTIQHDGYRALLRNMIEQSSRLSDFTLTPVMDASRLSQQLEHLELRGELQRRLYERLPLDTSGASDGKVGCDGMVRYTSRDRSMTHRATKVFRAARLIVRQGAGLHMGSRLVQILESWDQSNPIGGFQALSKGTSTGLDTSPLIDQTDGPIQEKWGRFVQFCRAADIEKEQGSLIFRLGLLAFGPVDMDVVHSLAAFACIDRLKQLKPPERGHFTNFSSRGRPSPKELEILTISACSTWTCSRNRKGTPRIVDAAGRTENEHNALCKQETAQFCKHILEQWPAPAWKLSADGCEDSVFDRELALEKLAPDWERRRDNDALCNFANQAQTILDSHEGPRDAATLAEWTSGDWNRNPSHHDIVPSSAQGLVLKPGPVLTKAPSRAMPVSQSAAPQQIFELKRTTSPPRTATEATELRQILNNFTSTSNKLRQRYGNDLLRSLEALDAGVGQAPRASHQGLIAPTPEDIGQCVEQSRHLVARHLGEIADAFAADDARSVWLQLGALWPCTRAAVLALLRSSSCLHTGDCDPAMKKALVQYGLELTSLQRFGRMQRALQRKNTPALADELDNPGHQSWSPHHEFPDWLLLEIDGDLLIRPDQVDVARAIIAPASGQNSVLQMNMGKGKTSVIMPMVVTALADGQTLARLIVPKALLMATAQVAQARLGGLVGRTIRHIPFSRRTKVTPELLKMYSKLHVDTREARGLILTSHEHLLSFKLGGWQHLADGKTDLSAQMLKFQLWLERHSRDVLDECDFTLSVKTQLNYPGGNQAAVDGQPFRWQVAEALLALVADHVPTLRREHPLGMAVLERPGSFPMVRFLRREAEEATVKLIIDAICGGRCAYIRPTDSALASPQGPQITSIHRLFTEAAFDPDVFAQAVSAFADQQASAQCLLVIRGLLINKILVTCLGKRWNVQYGLHPRRDPLAVPFEAKGTPSEHAEFGHPDVAIVLTCLAFYHQGLTQQQFLQGLQQLLQSADPSQQYEAWTVGCHHKLPETLRHWNVISVEDSAQVEELWEHLKYNLVVINHYLDHFVFPSHAKQFDVKLQASGWDIPLFPAAIPGARTTGFSGTNDNRTMLPLTIQQDDLPSLQQTSAEVLTYFLQPRNRNYHVTVDDIFKTRLSEKGLLRKLKASNIKILIDAGAYILEMGNKMLVKEWLGIDNEAVAAVYFGEDARAWVHRKGEGKEDVPLLASQFANNLDNCLVYFDEAHTRGVDLKLPMNTRGALTLALKQSKDFTMQAAMRLRQLGTTQSIEFFAPPDVDRSIRDHLSSNGKDVKIDSAHVIAWLLEQTCCGHEDLQSLYVSQGDDFCRRAEAACSYHRDSARNPRQQRSNVLAVMQKPERQTLEQLYGGAGLGESSSVSFAAMDLDPRLKKIMSELRQYDVDCHGGTDLDALQEVEQEREIQVQVEQVRQVQKRLRHTPLNFPRLHPDIEQFVRTGLLSPHALAPGFEQALAYVGRTQVGKRFGVRETGSSLFVSAEFGRTVKFGHGAETTNVADNFLRPVQWILWSPSAETALIVIAEEIEIIIPMLRLASVTGTQKVHMVAYSAPTTKAMLPFNSYNYYNFPRLPTDLDFPPWFRFEVGIVAGRLYVGADEWGPLKDLVWPKDSELIAGSYDGVQTAGGDRLGICADDLAGFLRAWLAVRHPTQDILHTPMGYICMGRSLEQSPFRLVDAGLG
ncbi:hypothetical protein RB598_009880 [Gaeumannomyces tritici]